MSANTLFQLSIELVMAILPDSLTINVILRVVVWKETEQLRENIFDRFLIIHLVNLQYIKLFLSL